MFEERITSTSCQQRTHVVPKLLGASTSISDIYIYICIYNAVWCDAGEEIFCFFFFFLLVSFLCLECYESTTRGVSSSNRMNCESISSFFIRIFEFFFFFFFANRDEI